MKYDEVDMFLGCGNYKINCDWYRIKNTVEHYKSNNLDMDPDFQRGHVWKNDDKVKFIEHVLMGGPGGRDLFFNCPKFSHGERDGFVLVDGKQRISAMMDFLNGKIDAFGHKYSEFEGNRMRCGYMFNIHINELPTKADVLRWYIEMNSGGIVHTQEEIERVKKMREEELKRT